LNRLPRDRSGVCPAFSGFRRELVRWLQGRLLK
jgi:hypothetical protein